MSYLHKITDLTILLKEWDKLDSSGTDLGAFRALCLEDRYYLLVKGFGRTDLLHPWLYARCREVEAAPDDHLDLWAREHYKSTIITYAGAIQEILNNPEITIGIFSHTGGIAGEFLQQIKKELDNNILLQSAFPDILYGIDEVPPPGFWNMGKLIVKRRTNPKEGTLEAHGLVEGMPVGKHFQLMIYDDVVTPSSVSTSEQIKKTTAAWSISDNLGASQEGQVARKWYIGTRYNFADTYQVMLDRKIVIPRIYPATEDGTMDGVPVFLTQAQWDKKKQTQNESDIACQMLQDPLSGSYKMFDTGNLEVYEIRPHSLNVYVMCDPARAMTLGSDNTAIAVIGVDAAMNKYLLDGINHRCDLQDRWKWVQLLYNKWQRVPGVQFVKVGYEKFGAIADLDYFKEQMKLTGQTFNITELSWTAGGRGDSSKSARVQRLGPDLRSHKFFIPYKTNDNRLTKLQQNMMDQGFGYRIARPIRRVDSDKNIYDLTEDFVNQLNYFPVGKKDFVDAASRLYDMEIRSPMIINENDHLLLEPMYP